MDLGNLSSGNTGAVAPQSTAPQTGTPSAESTGQRDDTSSRADFLNRFNEISERERALHAKEVELKSKFGSFQNDLGIVEKLKTAKSAREKMDLLGVNYADITREMLMGDNSNDEVAELKRRLAEIEGTTKETYNHIQQNEYAKIEQQAKSEINELVSNSQEFNLVKALGETDTVWELCRNYYDSTKKVLTYNDAAKLVEEDLRQKLGGLKAHSNESWLQDLIGVQKRDEPAASVTTQRPAETGPRETSLVHKLLGANQSMQSTSLGAFGGTSGAPADANRPKSDAELREASINLLRQLRQG